MNNNIVLPKKINVGFQTRNDTYTKKLAYIVYFDNKGVLRKEKSWEQWRNKEIDNIIYDNEPTSGFVLNKKAGGYSTGWNHRQTYVRVYDPRGFEFEITIPNLLYILENTNSIKGKGLEGEFVYGWHGADLILMPTSSPDYIELSAFNNLLHENKNIKAKDLLIGATYKTKDNSEVVYMGRFEIFDYHFSYNKEDDYSISKGKQYCFYHKQYKEFKTMKSIGDKLVAILDEECSIDYLTLFDSLEKKSIYSPYDPEKTKYTAYTFEELTKYFKENTGIRLYCLYNNSGKYNFITIRNKWIYDDNILQVRQYINNKEEVIAEGTLKDIYYRFKPVYSTKYLKNGNLLAEGKQI